MAAHTLPAAPVTPPPAPAPVDASERLSHRLTDRWNAFLSALDNPTFYIEALADAASLFIALLASRWLQHIIKRKIAATPPKMVDNAFILKILPILNPVLMLVGLWTVQILAIAFDFGGDFTGGIFELCYAYFLSYCVWLIVRSRPVAYVLIAAILINSLLHALRMSRSTTAFLDSIAIDIGKYHLTALHLVHGLVIFVVVFWIAGIASRTLETYLRRNTTLSHNSRELAVKFLRLFIYLIAFVITLSAMGIDLTAFAVFSGALGVGIGLGLQKLTANFVSGVTMLMEKSIKIGDLIEVSGNTGWVRQLNIRYALIETFDGKEILIPNEDLVSTRVINWTHTTTNARIDINILISFESDAEKARELMLQAALEHPACMKDPAPTCWLKEFTGTGVSFVLNFWIPDITKGRSGPQSDVQFAILRKFHEAGIALAKSA